MHVLPGCTLRYHHSPHGMGFTCVVGIVNCRILGGVVCAHEVPTGHLLGSTSHRLKSSLVKNSFLPLKPHGSPFVPHPWDGWGFKTEAST
jgi:hypothetical protein